jgi:hypothetical protein
MKLNSSIIFGILWLVICLGNFYSINFFVVGFGMLFIVSGLFEVKNYHNNKLYLAIVGVILAISLILIYIQQSSSLHHGYGVIDSILIVLFPFLILLCAYEFIKKGTLVKKVPGWVNYGLITSIILYVGIIILSLLQYYKI